METNIAELRRATFTLPHRNLYEEHGLGLLWFPRGISRKTYDSHLIDPYRFGKLAKYLRGNRTQESIANEMDVSQSTISDIEKSRRPPMLETAVKLYRTLGAGALCLAFLEPENNPDDHVTIPLRLLSPHNYHKVVGRLFYEQRSMQGYSQTALSHIRRQSLISDFENGKSPCHTETICDLFGGIGIPVMLCGMKEQD